MSSAATTPAIVSPAPPAAPKFTPSYELAEDLNIEAAVEVLAALHDFAAGIEEYDEADEAAKADPAEAWDFDCHDEVRASKEVLAGLLCHGGQVNDQGRVGWIDGEGNETFAFGVEEVSAWASDADYARLRERFSLLPERVYEPVV